MAQYYIYLISSLPALLFPGKPPFSVEQFLERCQGLIPESDMAVITSIMKEEELQGSKAEILSHWQRIDAALRNELVKIRSARLKIDPYKYLRQPLTFDSYLAGVATGASRNTSPLDAERAMDQARWSAIEELLIGHYFDFEVLAGYALKLKILLRWENILKSDKLRNLKEITHVN